MDTSRYLLSVLLIVADLGVAGCSAHTGLLALPEEADDPVTLRVALPMPGEPSDWSEWFAVYVDEAEASSTAGPVQGSYQVSEDSVTFRPDFPFSPGVRYRVGVAADLAAAEKIPGAHFSRLGREFVGVHFELPAPLPLRPPRVERVFPTSDALPENVLRFYIYFSNPMQRGWASRAIRLRGEDGRDVENVFMEFKQELWSPDQKRLTVLLDPGRIKRGVGTNSRLGQALKVGRRYTLTIEGVWQDGQGQPLAESFEKTFRVTPAIRSALEHRSWTLTVPSGGSRQVLALTFDRSLDHALLARVITVRDGGGQEVPGSVEVGREETQWFFHPQRPWASGAYTVVAQPILEDLAGNNLFGPLDRMVSEEANDRAPVTLAFEVRER